MSEYPNYYLELAAEVQKAQIKYQGLGMRNTHGLNPEDAAILDAEYTAAQTAYFNLSAQLRERAKSIA